MVEKKVEIEGVGLSRRDPRRNSVQDAGPDVENGGMATHLVTKRCDLGSVGVPALARTPLGLKPGYPGAAFLAGAFVFPPRKWYFGSRSPFVAPEA